MRKLSLLCVSFFLIAFSGCSSKKYFEPEESYDISVDVYSTDAKIIDFHSTGATLENQNYITKDGISTNKLKEEFRFLSKSDNTILSTNDKGVLLVSINGTEETITFDNNIVAASIKDGLIAFIMIDNSINLYDLKEKKTVFKSYYNLSILNDIKIASPVFLNTLILFPTLDGKVIIVDKFKKTVYKTINLDPKSDVNNIVYLKALGDTLIAATNNKLFSFANGVVKVISEDIRNITSNEDSIYLATLDGRVAKYNKLLQKLNEVKFQYANFYALAFGENLYALESQDYLIKFDKDLNSHEIYDFSFDEEDKVFSIDDTIYFEDSFIVLK